MKPRPTDTEFDELKRKRDAAIAETVARVCQERCGAVCAFHDMRCGP